LRDIKDTPKLVKQFLFTKDPTDANIEYTKSLTDLNLMVMDQKTKDNIIYLRNNNVT